MVDPSLTQGTLLCGFSEEVSSNNYSGNGTFSLPTHYKFAGNCQNTNLTCNELTYGIEGFRIEGSSTKIGSQGAINIPNGNKWLSWPVFGGGLNVSRINGNSQLTPVEWYWKSGVQTEDPQDFGTLTIPFGIFSQSTGGTSCLPCGEPCEVDRLYGILSSMDSSFLSDEDRFLSRLYLYDRLKDSLQLMYSGSTHDIELQNFFSAMALNNVGLLSSVEEMLADNDYANAQLFNEDINTSLLVEVNLDIVNEVCAQYGRNFDAMDSVSRANLEQIAYQHPLIGGPAVYRARAILGIDVDDTQLAFRQKKEVYSMHNTELVIIPNPSTGKVTLILSGQNEQAITVNVFNNLGVRVLSFEPEQTEGKLFLDMDGYAEGIYQVNVMLKSGVEVGGKIMLVGRK